MLEAGRKIHRDLETRFEGHIKELHDLRSGKGDIRTLAEFDIDGHDILKRLKPGAQMPADEAQVEAWKTQIERYLRAEHPEHFTYFCAEVRTRMFGEGPRTPSDVVSELLERLRLILERVQGLESKGTSWSGQPQHLPTDPNPPETPTC